PKPRTSFGASGGGAVAPRVGFAGVSGDALTAAELPTLRGLRRSNEVRARQHGGISHAREPPQLQDRRTAMNQSIQPTARRTQLRVAGASILAAIGVCATLLRPLAAASKTADEQSVPLTGQWAIDPGESRDQVRFTLKASGRGFSMSWSTSGTPVRKLEG